MVHVHRAGAGREIPDGPEADEPARAPAAAASEESGRAADAPTVARGAAVAALPFGRGAVHHKILKDKGLKEPSGIAFHAARGTLFAVGDRGSVIEMTRDGEVLNSAKLPKKYADLEGVTVGPKGRLYAVNEEKPPRIVEIDPDSLEVRRTFKIDAKRDGERLVARRANDGIEGIAWSAKEKAFFALNQDRPPRIVRLDVPLGEKDGGKARIEEAIDLGPVVKEWASDLAIDERTGHFLVTESGEAGVPGAVHEVTRAGEKVRSVRIPGETQEGFALDDRGSAYIAQDQGGIIRVDPA